MNDSELLQSYTERGSEAAFTELVNRYVDFVHSAALRQVGGDAHLAQDVTQNVFLDLARKARSLSTRTVLVGWLYTSARFAAANVVRGEQRRHAREQEAFTMQQLLAPEPSSGPDWENLRPALDAVMHELSERDRNALLLRYFEGRQLAEVGSKLGLNEDAARMRVGRALDKLRRLLGKRGVRLSITTLAALLGTETIQAAPAGLAAAVAGAALANATAGAGTTITLIKFLTMTKIKYGILAALLVAATATTVVTQHQVLSSVRSENRSLHFENERMATQLAEFGRLHSDASQSNNSAGAQYQPSEELIRLRGEVGRYRQEARAKSQSATPTISAGLDPGIEEAFKTLAARASFLKERLEQMPDKKIPELRLLSDKDWLDSVKGSTKLETDAEIRQALSTLRSNAKGLVDQNMQNALRAYTKASGGQLPNDLSELKPYFQTPLDDAILARYSLLQKGPLSGVPQNEYLVGETAPPVDDEYEILHRITLNGVNTSSVNVFEDSAKAAAAHYAQDNNGLLPTTPSQLAPYFKQPVDPARLQALLDKVPAGVTTFEQLKALNH